MKRILDLPAGRPAREIRMLFFPNNEDIDRSALSTALLELPLEYIRHEKTLPRLTKPVTIGATVFTTRRPEFLKFISDDGYIRIFQQLRGHQLVCPTWSQITTINNKVSDILRKIIKHVMFWYAPKWKYPAQRSNNYANFNWVKETMRVLLIDQESTAEEFLQMLWDNVELNDEWRHELYAKMV